LPALPDLGNDILAFVKTEDNAPLLQFRMINRDKKLILVTYFVAFSELFGDLGQVFRHSERRRGFPLSDRIHLSISYYLR